ncbi:hypothetical protein [Marinicrinis sediminis]|uniref:HEAT repeat domain-containing protein n=1 Tax=Marinicrinis sediminis TaxID=1652465 RepID=A0ABW5R656_9BACL
MHEQKESNVVLLPKTIEYYQFELTKYLETEKYSEAKALLRFLLRCQGQDEQTREEWSMLVLWLEQQFPGSSPSSASTPTDDLQTDDERDGDDDDDDGELESEAELHEELMKQKQASNPESVKRLLDRLEHGSDASFEKKWLALEQLVHLDHKDINARLKKQLQQYEHPILQYKLLQTLKLRKARGEVAFRRYGEEVQVRISDVPVELADFPESLIHILEKVKEVCEIYHPSLAYFAEQIWKEYVTSIFGTSFYRDLLEEASAKRNVWACALHVIALQSMDETQTAPEEIAPMYGIKEADAEAWVRSYEWMKECMRAMYRIQP